jgi:signal transduction histidine kinase
MHVFPERIGIRWVIAFILIMASSMIYGFGLSEGLGLLINYTIAYLMVAGLVTITKRAERAREKSQSLLGELQVAHQQLQDYADQIEELTVEQERSRLARNLHDSVTQTIFSMTLTAEAAKILMERDQKQTAEQLDKLLELARSALAEMRSLIFELRPTTIAEEGLIPALRQYLSTLEEHNNLKVDLQINGDPELSTKLAQRLFYIIREALNNIVKHANVDTATIDLEFSNEEISLRVEDQGIGFDSDSMDPTKKTMGLSSMRERVERCGGTLTIDSRPGIGTRVLVEVPTSKESGHDN